MSFQVAGLPVAPFAPFFGLSNAALAEQAIVRHTADRTPGFPCRVSLRDAEPGETLLLLNFEHLAVASPYRSRHAIYVLEGALEARVPVDVVPEVMRKRLLSLRAFDSQGMMLDADVVDGQATAALLERMFENPAVVFIDAHNAKPGCFAARINRVG